MKKFTRIVLSLFFSFFLLLKAGAQGVTPSGIGETMRSSGRIYVVVTVMVVILLGIVFYLIRLDRKISRLEKE